MTASHSKPGRVSAVGAGALVTVVWTVVASVVFVQCTVLSPGTYR